MQNTRVYPQPQSRGGGTPHKISHLPRTTFLVANPQLWAQPESPTSGTTLPCPHHLCQPQAKAGPRGVLVRTEQSARPTLWGRAGPCTCSNPPASGVAHHAEGDGREATAAVPEPGAAAQLTVRAWPGADVLLTWARRESLAGPCRVQLQPKTKQNKHINITAPSSPMAPKLS